MQSAKWLPVCQVITKEGTLYDPGGNHRGRLCHVQRNPGAAACLERKKHAVCDVCVSVGRSGLRSGVCLLDSFMRRLAGPGLAAGGRVLPDSRVYHRRHSSGRVCGYLRRAGQLCGTGKKAGNSQRPPLRCLCPDPGVQLFCGLFCSVRVCTDGPSGTDLPGVGICAGTDSVRVGRGVFPDRQKYRPGPYLCHGGGPCYGAPGPGGAGSMPVCRIDGSRRRGRGLYDWGGDAGAVAI